MLWNSVIKRVKPHSFQNPVGYYQRCSETYINDVVNLNTVRPTGSKFLWCRSRVVYECVARWGLLVHRAPIERGFTDDRRGLTSVWLFRHTVGMRAPQLLGIGCFCSENSSCPNVTNLVLFCDMTALTASQAIRETARGSFVPLSALPGPSYAARQAASRATRAGELVTVKPGLYYRGAKTRYGMTRPPVEQIAREVWGSTGVGPAGFSAAREWGVTTQVPATYHVAALWTVAPIDGVTQYSRRNRARGKLNPREIALLELLRDPRVFVESGWESLVDRYSDARGRGLVHESLLEKAVASERNQSVRQHFATLMADVARS